MLLLAEGVAAISTSMPGSWESWTGPQGVAAISGFIVTALSVIAMILNLLGKKDLAQKVQDAHDMVQGKNVQIQTAVDTLRSVIQGVEQAKSGLSPDAKLHLVSTIQEVATKMGGQQLLDPIVQAVQSGNTDSASLLKMIVDAATKVQQGAAAKPAA
jgi:gamma-glutamyl:cysteine ligase YbdK (ATP-grasp superfamily)